MVETLKKSLRDSMAARWTSLMIVSFTMLCGYYMADVLSPLKPLLEQSLKWNSTEYGFVTGAYAWLNLIGMLFVGGIILDKLGARFAGLLSTGMMVIGGALKYWAISTHALDGTTLLGQKGQILVAGIGFSIFGAGIEICGVTATKIIARWFKGYSMALAMGLQVGTARVGTALALGAGGPIASSFHAVSAPILLGVILLGVGLLAYVFYCGMDKKLDASEVEHDTAMAEDEEFRFSDIGAILKIKGFWLIAGLCALFYSSVFPFLKYAPDLMVQKYGISSDGAGLVPALLPFAAIPLTVLFGYIYDRKGKGATIMILGSVLLVFAHFLFSLKSLNTLGFAVLATIILGFGFSLLPSAMWPSVPKFIPHRQLGTAYALIFWLQNLTALSGVPTVIGWILDTYCVIGKKTVEGVEVSIYDYTLPMMVFCSFGVLAVVIGLLLKAEDKKKGFGLELPTRG